MNGERRGPGARLGIAALNLLWPGLGLLRTGAPRLAIAFLAAPIATLLLILAVYAFGPPLTFVVWSALLLTLAVVSLGGILVSALLSWRLSERAPADRWWSRWYGLAAIWLGLILAIAVLPNPQGHYRNFYVPGESMLPTLKKDDRFVASMRNVGTLQRGDIVLVRGPLGATYVKRVAALAGDRIAMEQGVVVLNGSPVPQRLVGVERSDMPGARGDVRRLAERFPGERGEHEIFDHGLSAVDHFAETVVRPGHIFLLGDNRDVSADSRVPKEHTGLEQVPVASVIGRPRFFSPWPGQRRWGQKVGD